MSHRAARQHRVERLLSIAIKTRRIDPAIHRQIAGELAQGLPQLQLGADRIALLMMIKSHGYVNHRLQKQPPLAAARPPDIFENFMALEELAGIEQLDAAL